MADSKDDAVPGPSNIEDVETPSSERVKKVTFAESLSSTPEEQRKKSSLHRRRQSSMIGSAGYVAQLVDELKVDEPEAPFQDEDRKPIRKQSLAERRTSIKEVEADIGYYMKSVARMSISGESPSLEKLPTISQEKLQEIKALSEAKIRDEDVFTSSEWLPSEILGTKPGDKIERSWVGTYIVGKDYWKDEDEYDDDEREREDRRLKYAAEDEKKPWYEIPERKTTYREEAAFLELKTKSLEKIDQLKGQMDKEFRLKRKERLISAAQAREKPKAFEEWTDNFKKNFQEVAKTDKFSHEGTHISMVSVDKWLENASILDHSKLTLIHTGICFQSSNGTRHRGLSFTEFTHFLQMISYTTGMPLRDITKRLEVCLRKVPSPKD